jgi:hypothetical protein
MSTYNVQDTIMKDKQQNITKIIIGAIYAKINMNQNKSIKIVPLITLNLNQFPG